MWRRIALFGVLLSGATGHARAQSPRRLVVLPAIVCGSEAGWTVAQYLYQGIWHSIDTTAYQRFDPVNARRDSEIDACGAPQDSVATTDAANLALGRLYRATLLLSVRMSHRPSGWFVEVRTYMPQNGEVGPRFDASSMRSDQDALDQVVPRVRDYLRGRGVRGFQIDPS